MKKIKVYYIGSKIKKISSGGDKYHSEVLQGLKQNYDLEIWDISECELAKEVRFRVTLKAISYAIKTNLWAINKLKSTHGGDVILINSYHKQQFVLIPWIAKYIRGCKVILSVNAFYDYSRKNTLLRIIDRIIMKLFLIPADRIIANSKPTKEKIKKMGIVSKKIKIIYPRLDLPLDLPDFCSKDNGIFHIVFVGYCTPYKEVDVLIRAMGILKTIPAHLHIVGETSRDFLYFDRLQNMVRHFGLKKKVTFHGRLEGIELSSQYKNANIFVNACRGEGYGRVFIEAMHFGLPVIGTNKGGARELIVNGANGFLFQPGNAEDLANKILILYENRELCEKMGKEGVKRSKFANFTKGLGEQVLQTIEELV